MGRSSGVARAAAWAVATGGAIALSWFGVSGALGNGVLDDAPRAFSVTDQGLSTVRARPGPTHSAPSRSAPPSPSTHSAVPTRRPASPSHPATRSPSASPSPSPSPSASAQGTTQTVVVRGGRVALMLHPASAELISASPNAGWSLQVWRSAEWLRVQFSMGASVSTVYCTWNGHPPIVQTDEQ
ncbi:hypothetical protein BIV57_19820 [Mangrovactinospora gilvigrisea]|uniref:Secreted protein n=1 Tax=Mangrovactinospora gilvigrisea TaxID=1428644 RepID=A0A1J7BQQ1_9ACTN|nr:hypothetical protein [Mangrovactinospora gilvigrisea]OIV35777.1 hypothetical protein BIV57_19820 [Mangrovactinospora gilvigrisea]